MNYHQDIRINAAITFRYKKEEELAELQYAKYPLRHILVVYLSYGQCKNIFVFFIFLLLPKIAETPSMLAEQWRYSPLCTLFIFYKNLVYKNIKP